MDLLTELRNDPDYINVVNESYETLNGHFEKIKEILYKPLSDENFNDAAQRFYEIFSKIPLMTVPVIAPQLIRGRPHFKGDPLCSERWQITYNWRYRNTIKLGRFNQEREPLFYASLPTETEQVDYVLSSALECCKELSIEYPNDVQDITVSVWRIKERFNVINMCFDDVHLADNPELKRATDAFISIIFEAFTEPVALFIERFLKFFSELSGTVTEKNEAYQVLTAMFVTMRHHAKQVNQYVNGLIYPSAMTLGKGLNIVLTRKAVKQYLKLDKVVMYRYVLVKPERTTYVADKCSDIVSVKNYKFKISGYIPPGRLYFI